MSTVLERFYSAFASADHGTMGACYHEQARFSDPVFPELDAKGAAAMWKMLLTRGGDLRITFKVVEASATSGLVNWDAYYTFSTTGRTVHNSITSEFELRDGLILRQRDRFSFWRWSRQALGMSGVLLGWTPIVQGKAPGCFHLA